MRRTRATLHNEASATATGVRFGGEVTLRLAPAEIGEGIVLERRDLGARWPLDLEHSSPGPGCSISGEGEAAVHFVEHVLAALWARGVSDCVVSVDGREIPLFDGSVRPVLALIDAAGVARSREPWQPFVIEHALLASDEERAVCALPGTPTTYAYALSYEHSMIGRQFASFRPDSEDFDAQLAAARTFITIEEAEQAQKAGLLAAGTEENCIVIHPDRVSQPPELSSAYARHKLVDMIGDLYLLGRPLIGHFFGFYTGHRQNHGMAREILRWCGGD